VRYLDTVVIFKVPVEWENVWVTKMPPNKALASKLLEDLLLGV
jgi:hypothetical protein